VEPTIQTRDAQPYAAIASTTSMRGGFGDVIDRSLPAVREHLASLGVEPTGPPLVIYRVIDMSGDLQIEVGWPVASEIAPDDRVRTGTLPAGRYVVGAFLGPYDGLQDANEALQQWADEQGLRWAVRDAPEGERWDARFESYVTDPSSESDPARWRTDIAYLLVD
jgi:effector-binding domain-containing protein